MARIHAISGLLLASIPSLAAASPTNCTPKYFDFKNLVSFGDSYTDEARLDYFFANNFTFPPPGTLLPERDNTIVGGYLWPRVVAQRTSAKTINYAIGGSTCSPDVVHRAFEGMMFPAVLDAQVPTYLIDIAEFEKQIYGPEGCIPENTVYTLWIGTNDLGPEGFLTGGNKPGTTLTDLVECNWMFLDKVYDTGGRYFVIFGTPPLELAPVYNPISLGGTGNTQAWPNKTAYDDVEAGQKQREYASSVNTMLEYGVPFQGFVAKRWPGATVSFLDAHRIIRDVHETPAEYLQDYTEIKEHIRLGCADIMQTDSEFNEGPLERYVWYDELHPSAVVEEIVAEEFIKLLQDGSRYSKIYTFKRG